MATLNFVDFVDIVDTSKINNKFAVTEMFYLGPIYSVSNCFSHLKRFWGEGRCSLIEVTGNKMWFGAPDSALVGV